jgi:regulation of enolase protein 1 (concanavalin A-like superfamily)
MNTEIMLPIVDFPMLEDATVTEMQQLAEELVENYEKRQQWRTETEMRFSVLNDGKFPTPASKYWQAVREQAAFYSGIVSSSFAYRREVIKNQRIKDSLDSATGLEAESLQIDLDESDWTLTNIELEGKDRVREIRLWSVIKAECVKEDPDFNTEDVNLHQYDSLYKQLLRRQEALTVANTQAERLNIVGPLATFDRVKDAKTTTGTTTIAN